MNYAELIKNQRATDYDFTFRGHLGGSLIGGPCSRQIWFSFRWFELVKFDGRMLRLFERGHLEELRFQKELESIGCEFFGDQTIFTGYKGHEGGACDGMVNNLPEFDETVLVEMKTHSDKSFKKLKKDGVIKSKIMHYAQMQRYMRYANLKFCLYIAVNKNDDELYTEIIEFNKDIADHYANRAADIIDASEPPLKISDDATWWECKFCDFWDVCHGNKLPDRNCRNCIHSTPVNGGKWECWQSDVKELSKEDQLAGCGNHRHFPQVVKAELIATDSGEFIYDNGFVDNGE